MMEFVLSRVWMVIAGVAVMAVLLASFSGLDRSVEREADLRGAEGLCETISDLQRGDATGELRVELDGLISGGEASFLISKWGIEVRDGRRSGAAGFLEPIKVISGGRSVDSLEVGPADVLVVRSSAGEVQVEKVLTM